MAIEDNEYTRVLAQLAETLAIPKAIVLFSAHWVSATQKISAVENYSTIHDFGGFPEELYRITYPAKGDVSLAKQIEELLAKQGIASEAELKRGLDHGAWVVLRLLYPEAQIPVVAMSVNPRLTPEKQYKIGQALKSLREQDVLIVGSGGTVHNLMALRMTSDDTSVDPWAQEFDDWLEEHLTSWDLPSLFQYEDLAASAPLAVPLLGNEHLVPIFYAMGAADGLGTQSSFIEVINTET